MGKETGEIHEGQHSKQLLKLIEKMSGWTGSNYWECFDKFLDVSTEATRRLMMFDFQWQPELSNFEKCREMFYEAHAILLANIYPEYTYEDVIGSTYMEVGIASKRAGQFFTPTHVARMMAQMTLADVDLTKYTPHRPMTVYDPACGSGVMFLAAASVLPREFIDEGRVLFYGNDIDATCVKMAQLNMMLYGLDRPGGFLKPTGELTEEEIDRIPEPYQEQVIEQVAEAKGIAVEEVKRRRKGKREKMIEGGQLTLDF